MHPGIKLLIFMVFALGGSAFALPATLGSSVVIATMLMVDKQLGAALKMLWRLKWLFIVLFALHGYYTAGPVAFPALGPWSPSEPGLALAVRRIVMLVVLVMAATWLLATTAKESLAAGIVWVLRPLQLLGWSTERFALRLTLALQQAPLLIQGMQAQTQTNAADHSSTNTTNPNTTIIERIKLRTSTLAVQCANAIRQAEDKPPVTITLPAPAAIRLVDVAMLAIITATVWGLTLL